MPFTNSNSPSSLQESAIPTSLWLPTSPPWLPASPPWLPTIPPWLPLSDPWFHLPVPSPPLCAPPTYLLHRSAPGLPTTRSLASSTLQCYPNPPPIRSAGLPTSSVQLPPPDQSQRLILPVDSQHIYNTQAIHTLHAFIHCFLLTRHSHTHTHSNTSPT